MIFAFLTILLTTPVFQVTSTFAKIVVSSTEKEIRFPVQQRRVSMVNLEGQGQVL